MSTTNAPLPRRYTILDSLPPRRCESAFEVIRFARRVFGRSNSL